MKARWSAKVGATIVLLSLLLQSMIVRADAQDAARLLSEATQLYADGAFEQSIVKLKRAEKITQQAGLLAKIFLLLGLDQAALNRTAAARSAFRKALRHDPILRIDAERLKPSIVALFERERATQVRASTPNPAGPASVPAASHPATRPSSRPAITPTPNTKAGRLWTWIAAGSTLAAAAAATTLGLLAAKDDEAACGLLLAEGRSCAARQRLEDLAEQMRYMELRDAAQAKAKASNVLWVVTGGLAAITVLIYLLEGRRPASQVADTNLPTFTPGRVDFTLRF